MRELNDGAWPARRTNTDSQRIKTMRLHIELLPRDPGEAETWGTVY